MAGDACWVAVVGDPPGKLQHKMNDDSGLKKIIKYHHVQLLWEVHLDDSYLKQHGAFHMYLQNIC